MRKAKLRTRGRVGLIGLIDKELGNTQIYEYEALVEINQGRVHATVFYYGRSWSGSIEAKDIVRVYFYEEGKILRPTPSGNWVEEKVEIPF
ncbi:hypothetical protein CQA49_06630 [Helicobacter sp. MIT 00-7814]|uniref:hypothetical protein n=1 Tax=unclassified Helicobacter TaxID=2593540 RepID=UPI000E1F032A|nr:MULTISPECIES: hypothetical protein [unclassified Helicobacter]RDU53318.1 hypothetical protein CQA49_06630 [Helicobacter sp. MIT 00-7814]RDU54139.1 hypothetical protein CQA37_05870 [Helicobacter sp. MIT 99-10781]